MTIVPTTRGQEGGRCTDLYDAMTGVHDLLLERIIVFEGTYGVTGKGQAADDEMNHADCNMARDRAF
jgi:hypothetical protein